MSYEPHKPGIWFREQNGAIHWRCHACDAVLPTTGADYPGHESAWASAIQTPCAAVPDATLPKAWKERKSRHQLGYTAHQGRVGWYRDRAYPVLPEPYESLYPNEQDVEQASGWNVLQSVLQDLIAWRTTQLSEGELCRRLGLDRMAWRDIRDQLGMTQTEEEAPVDETLVERASRAGFGPVIHADWEEMSS